MQPAQGSVKCSCGLRASFDRDLNRRFRINEKPDVEIRSGSIRQFQFPEYSDLRRGVKQRLHKGADQNQVSASGQVCKATVASFGARSSLRRARI